MNNALDVYNSSEIVPTTAMTYKQWYDRWPERKYLILDFLPSCTGRVLSVGTHFFNKNDEICCKPGTKYETIDIHHRSAEFGSTYKHTTLDFLDYNPPYKFDNIILFGVLGIPSGLGGYDYTLNEDLDFIDKIEKILAVNGRVLLGPDIAEWSGSGPNSYSTREFWSSLISNNNILKNNYSIELDLPGVVGNMVVVLRKNK